MGLAVAAAAALPARAATGCGFDAPTLSFAGTPVQQARCLLRPVAKGGSLGPVQPLPQALEALVGAKADVALPALQAEIDKAGIGPDAAGGKLSSPLSRTESGAVARYFVIHDTSSCGPASRFANSDEPDAAWNRSKTWANNKQGHLYVTRDGKLVAPQGRTFSTPWRATQLEMHQGPRTRGLFLHVENVQLRAPEAASACPGQGVKGNDRIAQKPGLSAVQMKRLALLYVAASARKREWLIPAFHASVDDGVGDHDDPQNFDVGQWAVEICNVLAAVGAPCTAGGNK
jgi:hypothetical protein